jgi:hypothetical protein
VGLSLIHLRKTIAHGALLWITRAGERLAGIVVEPQGERLLLRYIGVRAGDEMWIKRGVIAATYAHAIEHAWRTGRALVDFGGMPPWLGHGLLRYKTRWQVRLDGRQTTTLRAYLRWPDGNPHIAAMFGREALIVPHGGGFAFVAASGAWPPLLVRAAEGEWPAADSVPPPAQGHA